MVSFPEFIDSHYHTPPDRPKSPPIVSFSDSESLPEPVPPTSQRKRVWALQDHPYLPFILNSPFHGVISSRLATPPEQIHIDGDSYGFHIEAWSALSKSLDTLLLRRPRQGPDGGKPCLTDRTTFIPNSPNSWSIFPIAHFTTGPRSTTCKRVWALQNHPYLPFILNSPLVSSRHYEHLAPC
jgi:hypothetical protein